MFKTLRDTTIIEQYDYCKDFKTLVNINVFDTRFLNLIAEQKPLNRFRILITEDVWFSLLHLHGLNYYG